MPEIRPQNQPKHDCSCDAQRNELISSYLPLVRALACRIKKHLPQHIDINDLISAGMIGLLDAYERFDPDRGCAFATYARYRIIGAIHDDLRHTDLRSRGQRHRTKTLEAVRCSLEHRLKRPANPEDFAHELGLPIEQWVTMVSKTSNVPKLMSLDEGIDLPSSQEQSQSLQDPRQELASKELRAVLNRLLRKLGATARKVIRQYYLQQRTMRDIGVNLGISESRVSQIHKQAIAHLRSHREELDAVIDF